jgi:hydrogenase small subunit
MALGTCAAYGGIPAMRNNPTGAMGLRDYLGWSWTSRLGIPVVNLPGCPVQPDNITATLLHLALYLADMGPALDLDEQGRPTAIFGRTVHEGCNRAGLAEVGQFSDGYGDSRCLVKLGCKGPVVKCNVAVRGWTNGIGGCPNVGGICMACTMPGFPDKYMPFVDADAAARLYARTARIAHGPIVKYLRDRRIRRNFDVEPEWRRPGANLTSGYREMVGS